MTTKRDDADNSASTGIDCCLQLHKLCAQLDQTTQQGWSPLLLAARRGNSELCNLLLKLSGSNKLLSQTTNSGWNGLHMAVVSGSATTCQNLLQVATAKHKSQQAVVHQLDGTPVQMTPQQLAAHLNEHDDLYSQYSAVNEFGRSSSVTNIPSPNTAAEDEQASESSFAGVLGVFDSGINIEDKNEVRRQEVHARLSVLGKIL